MIKFGVVEKQAYSKTKEIAEGWYSVLLKKIGRLEKDKRDTAKSRLEKCRVCSLRYRNFCSPFREHDGIKGCGCYLTAKALVTDSKCPLGHW